MARMEMNCNLKKLVTFFKLLLSILEKLLKTDCSLVLLGEIIWYFHPGAVRLKYHVRKEVLSQIFVQFSPTYSKISVTVHF